MVKARRLSKFHLTPTETLIAMSIAKGMTLADIARSRGIAIGTARSHLKHVFRKTGTHRQAELVRAILSGVVHIG